MKIQVEKELKNNSYNVKISVIEIEDGNYLEAIHDFGETALNFGGQILDSDDTTVIATLADNSRKISTLVDKPVCQEFSVTQYPDDAEKAANRWATLSVSKIETYVSEMSAKIDTFSGTQIIDL